LPLFAHHGLPALRVVMAVFGLGMGFANTALVIAVQTSVSWGERGVATASTMFFRTIGGVVSVGVMGGVMLGALAAGGGLPPDAASRVLTREGLLSLDPDVVRRIAALLGEGLGKVFWMIAALTVIAFVAAMFFPDVPRGKNETKTPAPAPEPGH
jgi:hypothetical protein